MDGTARARACDLYHLGSMVAFMFDRMPLSVRLLGHLPRDAWPDRWTGTFADVLPLLHAAFADVLEQVSPRFPAPVGAALAEMLTQLCEPDPYRRGHPRARIPGNNPYDLQRYVSRLDLLARTMEGRRTGAAQRG